MDADSPSPTAPQVTLRQLELFCAAARSGSFSAAAQERYVTPNAVAAAVTDLETALKVRLCVRRRARGLELTPTGEALLARAQHLLVTAEEMVLSIADLDGAPRGPVRLGCYSTLAATLIPPLWEHVSAHLPGVRLEIVEGTATELAEQVSAGRLDMMIAYEVGLPTTLAARTLFTTEPQVILPVEHRLALQGQPVPLTQLAQDSLILLDLPPAGENTLELMRHHGLRPRVAHRTTSFELVRSLVARGFGYSLLFQRPQIDVSYEGRPLVSLPTEPALTAEPIVLAHDRQVPLTSRAAAIAAAASELFASAPAR